MLRSLNRLGILCGNNILVQVAPHIVVVCVVSGMAALLTIVQVIYACLLLCHLIIIQHF